MEKKSIPIIIALIIMIAMILMMIDIFMPYDSTDNISNRDRSGLVLYRDHMTGCEYIKGGLIGGITPRLDGNGNHIGCR